MSAKAPLIAALFAATALAGGAAIAQDDATDDPNAAMMEQFQRMHGMAEDFAATHGMAERHAIMQQHLALMQQMMGEGGMMGPGMMGGQGAMMHGDDDNADMAALRSQMMAMRQMMAEMMAQQSMMLQMQGDDADDDGDE